MRPWAVELSVFTMFWAGSVLFLLVFGVRALIFCNYKREQQVQASEAKDTTDLIIAERVRIAPLFGALLSRLVRK